MAQTEVTERLSLSWDSYQKIICNGLSQLQQHGEFVDMTLAADGHHVKVHQMVLSLVSPYIKDLISTAHSAHPIIFLNNISYTTLCSILEYIYTGEVHVPKNHLPDLITAGKALHIRGLREIDENETAYSELTASSSPPRTKSITERLRALKEKKIAAQPKEEKKTTPPPPVSVPVCKIYVDETDDDLAMDIEEATIDIEDSTIDIQDSTIDIQDSPVNIQDESTAVDETKLDTTGTLNNSQIVLRESVISLTSKEATKNLLNNKVQYTMSNQGGLQVIHNRFIYHLRYFGKKNRKRLWRCVDYSSNLKCPANICTNENNQVTERSFTHNHGFHDEKILRKVQLGMIYSIFQEAENKADGTKKDRYLPCSVNVQSEDDTESKHIV